MTSSDTLITHLESILPQDGSRDGLIKFVILALRRAIEGVEQALRAHHHVSVAGRANEFRDDRQFPSRSGMNCQ